MIAAPQRDQAGEWRMLFARRDAQGEAVVERPVVWPTLGRVGGPTIPVFSSEEVEELSAIS